MANATRRTLLRNGCAAIGAGVLSLELPGQARAQAESGEVFHVFAFQWKPGTSEAQIERAKREIAAFHGVKEIESYGKFGSECLHDASA